MNWVKRDPSIKDIKAVIEKNSGMSLKDLLNPTVSFILNLEEAVNHIKEAVAKGKHITIVGDYDADGITGSAILYTALRRYSPEYAETKVSVRLPRRITEGYGLNPRIVEELKTDVLLTIDNGIAASEAIRLAQKKGMTVVVLDHHVCMGIGPGADITVDPQVHYMPGDFRDYCGAGLAYRFSELLLGSAAPDLLGLAAIGTVADVVPLVRDNRIIVTEGLKAINKGNISFGLKTLIRTLMISEVNAEAIAYSIAPCLNAPGRLDDNGAVDALTLLLMDDPQKEKEAVELCEKIVKINRKRKTIVERAMAKIEATEDLSTVPIFVYCPSVGEGVVGLIAGKLAEKYKVPALVYTNGEISGVVRGSARSYGDYDLIGALQKAKALFTSLGGHKAAAGYKMNTGQIDAIRQALTAAMQDFSRGNADDIYYDLMIPASAIPQAVSACAQLEPFGCGNPKPVFCIKGYELHPVCGKLYYLFGKKSHIKLYGENSIAVGYGMAEKLVSDPHRCYDLIGTVGADYRGADKATITLLDFKPKTY